MPVRFSTFPPPAVPHVLRRNALLSDVLGLASSQQATKPSPWLHKPSQAKPLASRGLWLWLGMSAAKAKGLGLGFGPPENGRPSGQFGLLRYPGTGEKISPKPWLEPKPSQAKPSGRLWLWLQECEAKARRSQAKAGASKPSQAKHITSFTGAPPQPGRLLRGPVASQWPILTQLPSETQGNPLSPPTPPLLPNCGTASFGIPGGPRGEYASTLAGHPITTPLLNRAAFSVRSFGYSPARPAAKSRRMHVFFVPKFSGPPPPTTSHPDAPPLRLLHCCLPFCPTTPLGRSLLSYSPFASTSSTTLDSSTISLALSMLVSSGPTIWPVFTSCPLLFAHTRRPHSTFTMPARCMFSTSPSLCSLGTRQLGSWCPKRHFCTIPESPPLLVPPRFSAHRTPPFWSQHKGRAQLEKKNKDEENRTQRLLADAEVINRRIELGREGMEFTGKIKMLKAPQLKDLAWSLELDEVGTREVLIERVLDHFAQEGNEHLKRDRRYAELWREGRRRRAAAGPASSVDDSEQDVPMLNVFANLENIASGSGSAAPPYIPPTPLPLDGLYTFRDDWIPPEPNTEYPIENPAPSTPPIPRIPSSIRVLPFTGNGLPSLRLRPICGPPAFQLVHIIRSRTFETHLYHAH
ncbi:hypothetical protein B0H10DRAFT_2201543 [Mycena sp. CBHHK59/15]|nr:hypothetical protein B0H10DRAFT_2201543 [Mycena sp. CBHHK59/15]